MTKKIISLALALCMAVTLCACSLPYGNSEYPVIVGHTQIKSAPADNSVIVLDENVADVLIACGYTAKVMAVATECTQSEYSQLETVGTAKAPDVATITAMKPSLIFIGTDIPEDAKDAFNKAEIPTLMMAAATTATEINTLYSSVSAVFEGKSTGYKSGSEKAEKQLEAINSFSTTIPLNAVTKTVCYLYDVTGNAATGDTFGSFVIKCSGGENALEDQINGKVDLTTIAEIDPTYIFCPEGMTEEIKSNGVLATLSAVKKGKIIEMPESYMKRQGSSMLSAIEFMAKKLYPSMNKGETAADAESLEEKYGIEITEGMSLSYGESGDNIYIMQTRLDDLGYLPIDPTGEFLDNTVAAVKEFKEYNGISPTEGESADEATLKKMFSSAALERDTPARAEVPTLPQDNTQPTTAQQD